MVLTTSQFWQILTLTVRSVAAIPKEKKNVITKTKIIYYNKLKFYTFCIKFTGDAIVAADSRKKINRNNRKWKQT